jgi:hypothetical protein
MAAPAMYLAGVSIGSIDWWGVRGGGSGAGNCAIRWRAAERVMPARDLVTACMGT